MGRFQDTISKYSALKAKLAGIHATYIIVSSVIRRGVLLVESFLDFIRSLTDHSNVRTLRLADLDQEASPFDRPTHNRSPSFSFNVRNPSARLAVVFGSDRVASKGLCGRRQDVWDSNDATLRGGSSGLAEESSSGPGAARHWRQPIVQSQVHHAPVGPAGRHHKAGPLLEQYPAGPQSLRSPPGPGPGLYSCVAAEWF